MSKTVLPARCNFVKLGESCIEQQMTKRRFQQNCLCHCSISLLGYWSRLVCLLAHCFPFVEPRQPSVTQRDGERGEAGGDRVEERVIYNLRVEIKVNRKTWNGFWEQTWYNTRRERGGGGENDKQILPEMLFKVKLFWKYKFLIQWIHKSLCSSCSMMPIQRGVL